MAAATTKILIDKIFRTGVESNASDVHIVEGLPPILRIDGQLKQLKDYQSLAPRDTEDIC